MALLVTLAVEARQRGWSAENLWAFGDKIV